MSSKKELILILNNIRSVHNVGSIFRTADAAGVAKIYLVGTTPAPTDRFGRARADLAKVALGAEKNVEWEHAATFAPLCRRLKKRGYQIVALEQSANSVDYKKFKPHFPLALVLGREVEGVSPADLKLCDATIEIPMRGKKESLNVGVATGIAMYRLLNI